MQHLALRQEGSGRRLLILCAGRVAFGSYITFGRGPVQFFYPGCGIRKLGTGEPGGTAPPFLTPEDSSLALFQKDQRRLHSITHHRKDGAQLRPSPLPEDKWDTIRIVQEALGPYQFPGPGFLHPYHT